MAVLECRRVTFFSPSDEAAFFRWAGEISCVRKVEGAGDAILVHVRKPVSVTALRELLALFQRYRIAMSQLSQFATPSNSSWFKNREAYWYRKVFGRVPS